MMTSSRRQPLLVLCVLAATAAALAHHGPVQAEAALSSTVLGCDRARGTNCTCSECPAHNGFHAYCASTMQCLRSEADCGQCPDADQCVALSNCSGIPPPTAGFACGGLCYPNYDLCKYECGGNCGPCNSPSAPTTYNCDGRCVSLELCQVECGGNCDPCGAPAPVPPPTAGFACGGLCYPNYDLCKYECGGSCGPCSSPAAPTPAPPATTGYNCRGQCYANYDLCKYWCGGDCGPCQRAAAVPVAVAGKARASGFSCGGRCFASGALCQFECGGNCGRCDL